jgi:hypothetical protein
MEIFGVSRKRSRERDLLPAASLGAGSRNDWRKVMYLFAELAGIHRAAGWDAWPGIDAATI